MKFLVLALVVVSAVAAHKKHSHHKDQLDDKPNAYKLLVENFQSAYKQFLATHTLGKDSQKQLEQFFKKHEEIIKASRPNGKPNKGDKKAYDAAKHALKKAFEEAEQQLEDLKKQMKEIEEQKMVAAYKVHIDGFGQAVEKVLADDELSYEDLEQLLKKLKYDHKDLLEDMRPTGRPGGKPTKEGEKVFKDANKALEKAYKEAQHKVKKVREQLKKMEEEKMLGPYKVHVDSFEQAFEKTLNGGNLNYKDLEKLLKKLKEQHKDLLEDMRPTGRPGGRPTKEGEKIFKAADHLLNKSYDEAKDRLKAWKKQMEKKEKEEGKKHQHGKHHHGKHHH